VEADDWHVSGLTVGQVAERMSIAASAVRWYDDHGLLPSECTAGNQRRFFADVLCRVAMIRASQRVGLSIEEIREALSALPPRQVPTPEDWERLAGHLRHVASQRIGELNAMLDELTPASAIEAAASPRSGSSADDDSSRLPQPPVPAVITVTESRLTADDAHPVDL
jgi:MerR family transcriptional regulator, redox-sensitive transcriptional activator SoxR